MVFGAIVLCATRARADDAVTAEALFDRGVENLNAGNFDVACPALADSYRLDPKAGALFALADCNERWGKMATAIAQYQDYLRLVAQLPDEQHLRHAEREALARAGVDRLMTKVPGAPEHSMHVEPAPGDKKVVVLEVESPASSPVVPAPTPPQPKRPKRIPPAETVAQGPNRTSAWALGAVGAAALGAGAVTGIIVLNKKSTVSDECIDHDCSPSGKAAAESGQNLAVVADAFVGAGIAVLATATVLYLTAKEPKRAPAAVEPLVSGCLSSASVGVRTRW
jgi:hypothetical protein